MAKSLQLEKAGNFERKEVEPEAIRDFLSFLLSAFRAKLAVSKSGSAQCPFDYNVFLANFKWVIGKHGFRSERFSAALKFVVDQGLLDPLLPYLRSTLKGHEPFPADCKLASVVHGLRCTVSGPPPPHGLELVKKRIPKEEPQLIIHVCEEGKGTWQDFPCPQNVLVTGMGYFSRVAVKGQSLVDMDISVHCEIAIFQWLLDWILPTTNQRDKISEINAENVVGLVVSAEFLQMPTLTTICLRYVAENIEAVTVHSPNLPCLSDTLLARLANYFQNGDIERRIAPRDNTDRLTSRLYLQFILLMTSPEGALDRGHTASISSLFRCCHCRQLLTNEIAALVPCRDSVKVDSFGYQFSVHVTEPNWSLLQFTRELKRELKSWRRVYWRLWGIANYFLCLTCKFYYPARLKSGCKFHPSERNSRKEEESAENRTAAVQYSRHFGRKPFELPAPLPEIDVEEEAAIYSKRYSCCNAPCFRFSPIVTPQGCRTKNHAPDLSQKLTLAKLEILEAFEDLIVQENEIDIAKHLGKLRQSENLPRTVLEEYMRRSPSRSSGTQEGEWSSPERDLEASPARSLLTDYGFGQEMKESPRPGVNDLWAWNPDLSTRYNQDMQRELEEKFMLKLANKMCASSTSQF